jgi:hypothetical protein
MSSDDTARLTLDEPLHRLEVDATALRLTVEEYFARDDMVVPGYLGPHVVAVVFASRATSLTAGGREVRPIERETARRLHALAAEARGEHIRPGVDTAIGRTITQLVLQLDHARGPSHSFVAHAVVNHMAARALPPAWSALLCGLRDAFGPSRGTLADAWDLALTWCGPVALGPTWDAGNAVILPHVVTGFACDDPVFVRTGQLSPEGTPYRDSPSVLYRFDGTTLTCVDDRTTVAPFDDGRSRWRLPCGGATLTVHTEWGRPRRIVIRCDDTRGVYVQRDG